MGFGFMKGVVLMLMDILNYESLSTRSEVEMNIIVLRCNLEIRRFPSKPLPLVVLSHENFTQDSKFSRPLHGEGGC